MDAEVFVGHPLTFPVSSVAEKRGIPWISTALQPVIMFSGARSSR